eukprot:TRINITY_DN3037_c0_g1_i1.p1 TRINITY_DN3037_c0_g1~~TRINITY_DN3037_c0_g1_i1.p1  ORF type:complete len:932 (+),score=306.96 TRINITY_DN3037_c0_g1_i1:144-2939(+)
MYKKRRLSFGGGILGNACTPPLIPQVSGLSSKRESLSSGRSTPSPSMRRQSTLTMEPCSPRSSHRSRHSEAPTQAKAYRKVRGRKKKDAFLSDAGVKPINVVANFRSGFGAERGCGWQESGDRAANVNVLEKGTGLEFPVDVVLDGTPERSVTNVIVTPIIEGLEMGLGAAVFALGADGSGKTHSLFMNSEKEMGIAYHVLRGLVNMQRTDKSVRAITYSLFGLHKSGKAVDWLDPKLPTLRVEGLKAAADDNDDTASEPATIMMDEDVAALSHAGAPAPVRELAVLGALEPVLLDAKEAVSQISTALARRKATAGLDASVEDDPAHTVLRFHVTFDTVDEHRPEETHTVHVAEVNYWDSSCFTDTFDLVADGDMSSAAFQAPITRLALPKLLDYARPRTCHIIACLNGSMGERPLTIRTLKAVRSAFELQVEPALDLLSMSGDGYSVVSDDPLTPADGSLVPGAWVTPANQTGSATMSGSYGISPAQQQAAAAALRAKLRDEAELKLGKLEGMLQAKTAAKVVLQARLGRVEYYIELEELRRADAQKTLAELTEEIARLKTEHPQEKMDTRKKLSAACRAVPEKRHALVENFTAGFTRLDAEADLDDALKQRRRAVKEEEELCAAVRRLVHGMTTSPDAFPPEQVQRELRSFSGSSSPTRALILTGRTANRRVMLPDDLAKLTQLLAGERVEDSSVPKRRESVYFSSSSKRQPRKKSFEPPAQTDASSKTRRRPLAPKEAGSAKARAPSPRKSAPLSPRRAAVADLPLSPRRAAGRVQKTPAAGRPAAKGPRVFSVFGRAEGVSISPMVPTRVSSFAAEQRSGKTRKAPPTKPVAKRSKSSLSALAIDVHASGMPAETFALDLPPPIPASTTSQGSGLHATPRQLTFRSSKLATHRSGSADVSVCPVHSVVRAGQMCAVCKGDWVVPKVL